MVSVASAGAADRITARILFIALRAGSGTPARYSSTVFGGLVFAFFMPEMLPEASRRINGYGTSDRADLGHPRTAASRSRWSIQGRRTDHPCRRHWLSPRFGAVTLDRPGR